MQTLSLVTFRSYRRQHVLFSPTLNILTGPNGAGKTNLLEAIAYMAFGKSPRAFRDADLPSHGEDGFRIAVAYADYDPAQEPTVASRLEIAYTNQRRRIIRLDGRPIPPADLYGRVLTVFFSPDDLSLLKGAPSVRRALLDRLLVQAEPMYADAYRRYRQALLQRNATLREVRSRRADRRLLAIWDQQLIEYGGHLLRRRSAVVAAVSGLAAPVYADLAGEGEDLRYRFVPALGNAVPGDGAPVWEDYLRAALGSSLERDLARALTSYGPHRDDLEAELSGRSARHFASQGQQRSAVLALKFAERKYLESVSGRLPILLVDDVLSELDPIRRQALEHLLAARGQVFVTTADQTLIAHLSGGAVFQIRPGEVTRQK